METGTRSDNPDKEKIGYLERIRIDSKIKEANTLKAQEVVKSVPGSIMDCLILQKKIVQERLEDVIKMAAYHQRHLFEARTLIKQCEQTIKEIEQLQEQEGELDNVVAYIDNSKIRIEETGGRG